MVADAVNEQNRKSAFQAYLVQIKSLPQYKNKTWKDSEFELGVITEEEETKINAKTIKNAVFWNPLVQRGRGSRARQPLRRPILGPGLCSPNSRGFRSPCSRLGLPPQRCLRGVKAHSGRPPGTGAPPSRLCSPSPRPISHPSRGSLLSVPSALVVLPVPTPGHATGALGSSPPAPPAPH